MTVLQNLQGIDVSHYQGQIDWARVKAAGIAFAYAKASDGDGYTDPDFHANWQAMRAAGIARGAYHFFETADDPAAQAEHFLAVVGALAHDDLPPVVDIETFDGAYGGNSIAANLRVWLDTVEQALGRTPMIYTNHSFWDQSVGADFSGYPLWIAEYGVDAPQLPTGWTSWNLWQHSEQGQVDGIDGQVDLDAYAGTDLATLLERSVSRLRG